MSWELSLVVVVAEQHLAGLGMDMRIDAHAALVGHLDLIGAVIDLDLSHLVAFLVEFFAYLRRREPDDNVGYSILIYYLDNQDLDAALNRSPLEWDKRAAGF